MNWFSIFETKILWFTKSRKHGIIPEMFLKLTWNTHTNAFRCAANVEQEVADVLFGEVAGDSEAVDFDDTPLQLVLLQSLAVELPRELLVNLEIFFVLYGVGAELRVVELRLDNELRFGSLRKVLRLEERGDEQQLILLLHACIRKEHNFWNRIEKCNKQKQNKKALLSTNSKLKSSNYYNIAAQIGSSTSRLILKSIALFALQYMANAREIAFAMATKSSVKLIR